MSATNKGFEPAYQVLGSDALTSRASILHLKAPWRYIVVHAPSPIDLTLGAVPVPGCADNVLRPVSIRRLMKRPRSSLLAECLIQVAA